MRQLFHTIVAGLALQTTLPSQVSPQSQAERDLAAHVTTQRVRLDSAAALMRRGSVDSAGVLITSARDAMAEFAAYYRTGTNEMGTAFAAERDSLQAQVRRLSTRVDSLQAVIRTYNATTREQVVVSLQQFLREQREKDDLILRLVRDSVDRYTQLSAAMASIASLRDSSALLSAQLSEALSHKSVTDTLLSRYESQSLRLGFSVGFNAFTNNQRSYYIGADSLPVERSGRNGVSGIVSAVLLQRLGDGHNLVVSVPLGDFTSNREHAVGLFNDRIAVGLGYAGTFSSAPRWAWAATINASPYEQLDFERIRDTKIAGEPGSKLDPGRFYPETRVSWSFAVGVVYAFVR